MVFLTTVSLIFNSIIFIILLFFIVILFKRSFIAKNILTLPSCLSIIVLSSIVLSDIFFISFKSYNYYSYYTFVESTFNSLTIPLFHKTDFSEYSILSFNMLAIVLYFITEYKFCMIWITTVSNPFINKKKIIKVINSFSYIMIFYYFIIVLIPKSNNDPSLLIMFLISSAVSLLFLLFILYRQLSSLDFLKERTKLKWLLSINILIPICILLIHAVKVSIKDKYISMYIFFSTSGSCFSLFSGILKVGDCKFGKTITIIPLESSITDSINEELITNRDQSISEVTIENNKNKDITDIIGQYLSYQIMKTLLQGLIKIGRNNEKQSSIYSITKAMETDIDFHDFQYNQKELLEIKTKRIKKRCCCNCLYYSFGHKNIHIKEYAPNIFHNIRLFSNINSDTLFSSFDLQKNKENMKNCFISEGKSNQIFMLNYDRKFLIKSITNKERESFLSFIKSYYDYLNENKYSFLCKIFGLYTINYGKVEVNFVLMENAIPILSKDIIYKFDLKGSTFERNTKKLFENIHLKTLKDNDFLTIQNKQKDPLIQLSQEDIFFILNIIKEDVYILTKGNFMDYSLLIGIAEYHENENINIKESVFLSKDKKYIICISIIDYLTNYGIAKSLETLYKSIKTNKETISAVNPSLYSRRFIQFMKNNVFIS